MGDTNIFPIDSDTDSERVHVEKKSFFGQPESNHNCKPVFWLQKNNTTQQEQVPYYWWNHKTLKVQTQKASVDTDTKS